MDSTYIIKCPMCGKKYLVPVREIDVETYEKGELVQNAFSPSL